MTKTLTAYPSYDAELSTNYYTTYALAHDDSGDNTDDSTAYYNLGQWKNSSTQWSLHRIGIIFDLSSLSATADITDATLTVTCYWDKTTGDEWDVTIVDGQTFQNPAVVADYGQLLTYTTSWGEAKTSGATDDEALVITMNATGRAAIVAAAGGDFKIGLKSSEDISETAPAGIEIWMIKSRNDGTQSNRPKLTITYGYKSGELAGLIAVVEERLHYVDAYGVQRQLQGTAVT